MNISSETITNTTYFYLEATFFDGHKEVAVERDINSFSLGPFVPSDECWDGSVGFQLKWANKFRGLMLRLEKVHGRAVAVHLHYKRSTTKERQ